MNDLLLLAMLLPGPKYGYQLKREAGWMMGREEMHNNIVYPMLRRFLTEKWVSKRAVPGDRGQTRQQYALTTEGRKTFFERMNSFSESDASSEEAFSLRLGVFAGLRPASREAVFSGREKYLERLDGKLATLQASMDLGKFGAEIIRYKRKQIAMEQEWIRHLRRIAKTLK